MRRIPFILIFSLVVSCGPKKEKESKLNTTEIAPAIESISAEIQIDTTEADAPITIEEVEVSETDTAETVAALADDSISELNYKEVSSDISTFQLGSYAEEEEMPSSFKDKEWTAYYIINGVLEKQGVELEFGVEEMQDCGDDIFAELSEEHKGITPLFLISGLNNGQVEASPNNISFDFQKGPPVDAQYNRVSSFVKWTAFKTIGNDTIQQSLLDQERVSLEANYKVVYQGDIDGDGQDDLVTDMAEGYSYSRIVLFLSSRAKEGEVLAAVAQFLYWYC
tara:strand:+ start:9523 stop:10362 length:840 start_codon:yes stop_codon:yes gene_type:complete